MFMRLIPFLVYLVMQFSHVAAESRNNLTNAITAVDANVVFLRHALAPGMEIQIISLWVIVILRETWTLRVDSKLLILAQPSSVVDLGLRKYSPVNGVAAKKKLN